MGGVDQFSEAMYCSLFFRQIRDALVLFLQSVPFRKVNKYIPMLLSRANSSSLLGFVFSHKRSVRPIKLYFMDLSLRDYI